MAVHMNLGEAEQDDMLNTNCSVIKYTFIWHNWISDFKSFLPLAKG
jgi:hypothetical protein